MKLTTVYVSWAYVEFLATVWALKPHRMSGMQYVLAQHSSTPGSVAKEARFSQYIDHKNPSHGSFSQYYRYDDTFWAGPGSPVVFSTPGEAPLGWEIDEDFTDVNVLLNAIAKAIGGAIVVLEHRYYGRSSPFQNLTTENLEYLNLRQVIADFTNFADNVRLPFDPKGSSRASKAAWVFSGCSYSGALVGWTAATAPGTFWAYQASSAVVEAVYDFWQYFVPIERGIPKNCLHDIRSVVKHINKVLGSGTQKEKEELKAMFKLEDLQHDVDFASAILNPIYDGQYASLSGKGSLCNFVENVAQINRDNQQYKGVGLNKALKGYARYFTQQSLPHYCESYYSRQFKGKYNTECFQTFNKNGIIYSDTSVSNPSNRQFMWLVCNELGYYFMGSPPKGRLSIVPDAISSHYEYRQCREYFPAGSNGQTFGKRRLAEADTNRFTQGWNFENSSCLVWANSEFDPYREATVSANSRPGGPLKSTPDAPVYMVKGGFHCSDIFRDSSTRKEFDAQVEHIRKWVAEYSST